MNIIKKIIVTLISAFYISPCLAQGVFLLPSFDHDIAIGKGFNSIGGVASSSHMSHCVENSGLTTIAGTQGSQTVIEVTIINSKEELIKKITKDGSIEGGFIGGSKVSPFSADGDFS